MSDMEMLARVVPQGLGRYEDPTISSSYCGSALYPQAVYRATVTIPETPLRVGDFLLKLMGRTGLTRQERAAIVAARVEPFPRSKLDVLQEHQQTLRYVASSYEGFSHRSGDHYGRHNRQSLAKYLKNRRTREGDEYTTQLVVLRPLVAPVSEPVEAENDDAALFELLASAGGRMPEED